MKAHVLCDQEMFNSNESMLCWKCDALIRWSWIPLPSCP